MNGVLVRAFCDFYGHQAGRRVNWGRHLAYGVSKAALNALPAHTRGGGTRRQLPLN
jgi:hypothetical protein